MKKKLIAMMLSVAALAAGTAPCAAYGSTDAMEELNLSGIIGPYPAQSFYDDIYSLPVDYSLWDDFIKYDLCIADYDSLTDEKKELCKFIFETERSANNTVVCERARRTLAGDTNLGERITLEDLEIYRQIYDPQLLPNSIANAIPCVPDISHLDYDCAADEYWLDESGDKKILYSDSGVSYAYIELTEGLDSVDGLPGDDELYNSFVAIDSGRDVYCAEIEFSESIPREEFELDGLRYWTFEDGTVAIIGCKALGSSSDEPYEETIVIPQEINGYTVTKITGFDRTNITGIELPDTIELIDEYAFAMCPYLTEIEIECPEAVVYRDAFYNSGLQKAVLNIKSIDTIAFDGCSQLEIITLGENVELIGAYAFRDCEKLAEINIPSTLKYIGQGAFEGTAIGEKTIPDTVEIIGTFPFRTGKYGGGIGEFHATDPLTDEPVCVFDPDCVINGWYNTEAHRYALEWGLKFNPMDEDVAYGDTNLDGKISMADMVLLQSYLTGNVDTIGYEADLISDGIIDAFDMIRMRKILYPES